MRTDPDGSNRGDWLVRLCGLLFSSGADGRCRFMRAIVHQVVIRYDGALWSAAWGPRWLASGAAHGSVFCVERISSTCATHQIAALNNSSRAAAARPDRPRSLPRVRSIRRRPRARTGRRGRPCVRSRSRASRTTILEQAATVFGAERAGVRLAHDAHFTVARTLSHSFTTSSLRSRGPLHTNEHSSSGVDAVAAPSPRMASSSCNSAPARSHTAK